jgi:hypothetical protein
MKHYEPLERIQNIPEYEDYDGFLYFNDTTDYLHIRAFFAIEDGRRVAAHISIMSKDQHGNELWPLPVSIDRVPVATLEAILAAHRCACGWTGEPMLPPHSADLACPQCGADWPREEA